MTVRSAYEYGRQLRERDVTTLRIIGRKSRDPISAFLDGYYGLDKTSIFRSAYEFVKSTIRKARFSGSSNAPRDRRAKWNSSRIPRYRRVMRPKLKLVTIAVSIILLIGLSSVAFPKTTDQLVGGVVRFLFPARLTHHLLDNVACAGRKLIRDEHGRQLGLARRAPACRPDPMRYRSIPVSQEVAARFAPAAETLEGEMTGRFVVQNVNLKGLLRAILYGLTPGKKTVGGTNLVQSVIETTAGQPHALSFWEKGWLMLVGAHFTAHNLETYEKRVRFVASNMQCAYGGNLGGPISGDLCASLFGKRTTTELNDGELCLWAAMGMTPLVLPRSTVSGSNLIRYAERFKKLKNRASICAQRWAANNPKRRDGIEREIDAVPLPVPSHFYDVDTRLNTNLPGGVQFLREGGIIDSEHNGIVTINGDLQQTIANSARRYLSRTVKPRLNSKLCVNGCADERRVDMAVTVAEAPSTGQIAIRAAYQTRARLLHGPAKVRSHRSLGSAAKELFVPLLIDHNIRRLCRESWANLHDSDGFAGGDCRKDSDWIELREAIARSSNLAFAWGLRRIEPSRLRRHLVALGFDFNPAMTDGEVIRSAVTGERVTMTPLRLVRAYATLAFYPQQSYLPSAAARGAPITPAMTFPGRGAVIRRSKDYLPAPAALPSGTARSALTPLTRAGCRIAAIKTGTADSVVAGRFRDKVVVIAAQCGDRRFVAFGMVGSPNVRIPLGEVRSHELVQLVARSIVQATRSGGQS